VSTVQFVYSSKGIATGVLKEVGAIRRRHAYILFDN
jgi:hypothetical protein